MDTLVLAYDAAVASAADPDLRVGTTTTRVTDFVNRGAVFDDIYIYPPLLAACRQVIGAEFKLSSLQARTLRPHMPDQGLHVDVPRDSPDWPLLGFILMIDDFRADNGATRFLPGSHRWPGAPGDNDASLPGEPGGLVVATGSAGSLLMFNGSTWHGHGENRSSAPRRSLQGAFIPRIGRGGTDFGARMQPATRERLGPIAEYVLAL
jgi:ectoine hydroxylase-related dioxygenase (phytanoyl-CoA dioxygenase family)